MKRLFSLLSPCRAILAICALCGALGAVPLAAEDAAASDADSWHDALGMYGATLGDDPSGGLQYQHWFDRAGYQITGGGYYSPNARTGRKFAYAIMVEGLYTVFRNTYSTWLSGRLFLWALAGHRGYLSSADFYKDETLEDGTLALNALTGAGIGIDTILFGHFSFPLEFGYVGEFPVNPGIQFSVSGGIRYRF